MKTDVETTRGDLREWRHKMRRVAAIALPLAGLLWLGLLSIVWWFWH